MSRLSSTFDRMRKTEAKGFIPFVTVGDPDPGSTLEIVLKLDELGADIVELGVPFSDPIADGPTIQRSSQRALKKGTTLEDVLSLASTIRKRSDIPIVLFTYFNPVFRLGLDAFRSKAADAGIDGVLITDVIDHEAASISDQMADYNIDLISLAAPTTSDERLKRICERARGFVYAVSRKGVTGAEGEKGNDAERLVDRIRSHTDVPVAVGFGISSRQQIEQVWKYADAAVVGSALVAAIESAGSSCFTEKVERFVTNLLPGDQQ